MSMWWVSRRYGLSFWWCHRMGRFSGSTPRQYHTDRVPRFCVQCCRTWQMKSVSDIVYMKLLLRFVWSRRQQLELSRRSYRGVSLVSISVLSLSERCSALFRVPSSAKTHLRIRNQKLKKKWNQKFELVFCWRQPLVSNANLFVVVIRSFTVSWYHSWFDAAHYCHVSSTR